MDSGIIPSDLLEPANVTFADLEGYVLKAEKRLSANMPDRATLFRRTPDVLPPRLRSDCESRILVYPGCFDPPHLSHLALLWHAFLCTDDKTIAAMFLPMTEECVARKSKTVEDGRAFKLSLHQRTQLLQDDILGRFTWVYPGQIDDVKSFMREVQDLAAADGYRVSFPSLHGGDYFDDFDGRLGWGTGSIVASNVTRPLILINEENGPGAFPKCGKWRAMSRVEDVVRDRECSTPACWPCGPCWPCRKLEAVCPEFSNGDGSKDDGASFPHLKKILDKAHSTQGLFGGRAAVSTPSTGLATWCSFPEVLQRSTRRDAVRAEASSCSTQLRCGAGSRYVDDVRY